MFSPHHTNILKIVLPICSTLFRKSRIIDNQGRGGGVRRCDENNTINELVLYNELAGTIPTEIGRLWNLQIL